MNYNTNSRGMFCGQSEAISRKYHKHVGKSGNIWLVADQEDAGADIYVTNNPQNTTSRNQAFEGFGGATLSMPLVDGTTFELRGGWHSNSDALFNDTGVDVRDKIFTFVVLSKGLDFDKKSYGRILTDVVYQDEKPTLGNFYRYKDLIKQYPEANFYYSESKGGSSSGTTKNEKI